MPGARHFGQVMVLSFMVCGSLMTNQKDGFHHFDRLLSTRSHIQYSQKIAPHSPHCKHASRYVLVTPQRMALVSRHSRQLMSWPHQCPLSSMSPPSKSFGTLCISVVMAGNARAR